MKKAVSIFILSLFFSCQKKENLNFVACHSLIKSDTIKETRMDRGIIKLTSWHNKHYYVYDWSDLEYNDSFPKWIKDHNKPDYSLKEYQFEPRISDIDVPYVLFKKEKDCYFYVVKYGDTLKFKIPDEK